MKNIYIPNEAIESVIDYELECVEWGISHSLRLDRFCAENLLSKP